MIKVRLNRVLNLRRIKNLDFLDSHSFLPLQIFIYFERIYTVVFFLAEIVMYVVKANYLVYPPGNLATEIVGLFFLLFLQFIKINNANKANKAEIKCFHFYTFLFSFPVLGVYLFYCFHQVYVLYFDLILTSIGMFFSFFEAVFAIIAIIKIPKNGIENY